MGAQKPNDFAAWQPDAVIVNLGTNDTGAMENPPCPGPDGVPFQQRNDPEGLALLEEAAFAFPRDLRRRNPSAKLVWAYGMLGETLRPSLERAVNRFWAEDSRTWFLPLPEMRPEDIGSRLHPGPACHQIAADTLTTFLKTIL